MSNSVLQGFLSFLHVFSSNPATAPVAQAVAASVKSVETSAINAVPVLINHEADVIAAHNKNHPQAAIAAETINAIGQMMFAAYLHPTPTAS